MIAMNKAGESAVSNLKELPSVDEVLRTPTAEAVRGQAGERRLTAIARMAVESLRGELLAVGHDIEHTRKELLDRAACQIDEIWLGEQRTKIQKVINATGVIIHTNLGRAPLSDAAINAVAREASGYCTVEYDLATGKRGRRGGRTEKLLCQLAGGESAVIVNNCAAAAFLVLSVLAADSEVVVSRGELVEIGGDFRIPDVLTQSGARLREVGTTNRTKIADFENAIGERTSMLLRVHPSNYRITGFTEMPTLASMAELAHKKNLVLYEDAGSGALNDLKKYGLTDEPVIAESIRAGVDIVSFSGDKLLGGPQAGIVVGRREIIEKLRNSPLYRALRVSKLTYAALEATLEAYASGNAETEVPVLKMIEASAESLEVRTLSFAAKLRDSTNGTLEIQVISGGSVVGGGAAPDYHRETSLAALRPVSHPASALERRLRIGDPPVIARLHEGRVLIDLRTVDVDEEDRLLAAVSNASGV